MRHLTKIEIASLQPDAENETDTTVLMREDEPPMYRVLLLNDDYTTMEFVVEILMFIFNKSTEEAIAVMLNVHQKGAGVCGVYSHEIAETKVNAVHALALEQGFPLKCIMEKD